MKKFTTPLVTLLGSVLFSGAAFAQLPPAPSGFAWESQGVSSYSDTDNFSTSLDGSQSLAPSGPPAISSLAETLSLTEFDAAGEESALEAAMPGMDFAIVVLSSTYATSLDASASTIVFNFDSTSTAHDYSGAVNTANFTISGAGSAGPVSDALANPAFNVAPFSFATFEDTSSATMASISASDTGTAGTSGGTLNFNFAGSAITFLSSDDPAAATQMAIMSGSAFGMAEVTADYETYKLVPLAPVPEPSGGLLALFGAILLGSRRRR